MPNKQNKECKPTEVQELRTPSDFSVYKQLAKVLPQFRNEPPCSRLFIVEGTLRHPRVGLRYPGYKLMPRILKKPNKKSALWANLLDFEVVPFIMGKEESSKLFTYRILLKDFELYKKDNVGFWVRIEQLHKDNFIPHELPELRGIEPRQFLEMLKWMWIQEDLNYKLSSGDVDSSLHYRLQNKSGSATANGAGRDKFYAALLLVKHHKFDAGKVGKIIP